MSKDIYIDNGIRMLNALGREPHHISSITCAIADILYAAHAEGLDIQEIIEHSIIHAKHIRGEG